MAKFPCLVCGYLTLRDPDSVGDLCSVCGWERVDGSRWELAHPTEEVICGQPSLNEARENFRRFGAVNEEAREWVRPPRPDELPDRVGDL